MNGYIYLLKNPHISFVKVGFTTKTPEERALDISSSTGVPGQFKVVHYWKVEHAHKTEQRLFKGPLRPFRLDIKQEFFRLEIEEAILKISDFLQNAGIDPLEQKERELAEMQRKYEEEKIEKKRLLLEKTRDDLESNFVQPLLLESIKNVQVDVLKRQDEAGKRLKAHQLDLQKDEFTLKLRLFFGFVVVFILTKLKIPTLPIPKGDVTFLIIAAFAFLAYCFFKCYDFINKYSLRSKRCEIDLIVSGIEDIKFRLKKMETDFLDYYLFSADENQRWNWMISGYPTEPDLQLYFHALKSVGAKDYETVSPFAFHALNSLGASDYRIVPPLTIDEYYKRSYNAVRGYWQKLPPLSLSQILTIKSEHDRYKELQIEFNDLLEKEYQRILKVEENKEKQILNAIKYSGHKRYYGRRRRY